MCRVDEAVRIFYNWMLELADALALEAGAAFETNNFTIKENQMAPDIASPEDKNTDANPHHSNGAVPKDSHLSAIEIRPSDIDRILALEHTDPHTFLGAHRS